MSKYITMVDADDDYLQHGKFIAKVKGLGGKVRYFYDTNEYMAFLKGGKNGYNAQKKTNAMNKAMNDRARSTRIEKSTDPKFKGWDEVKDRGVAADEAAKQHKRDNKLATAKLNEKYKKNNESANTYFNATSGDGGKAKDARSKAYKTQDEYAFGRSKREESHSKYITNKMNDAADKRAFTKGYEKVEDAPVDNVYRYKETGPAADAKVKAKKSAEARAEAYSKQLNKHMNNNAQSRSEGPATDARERQKALEKRMAEVNEPARINKLNDTMNKGIDQQGRDVEGAVRRDEYDKRVAGVEHKPPVYKPSTYEKMHKKYVNERNEQAEKNRDTRAGVGQLTGPDVLNNRGVAADEATKTWERQQMTEAKKKEAKKKKYVK